MFTAELKVNGVPVMILYGHNRGPVGPYDEEYQYFWELIEFGEGKDKIYEQGYITHWRSDGLGVLVKDILAEVFEKEYKPDED